MYRNSSILKDEGRRIYEQLKTAAIPISNDKDLEAWSIKRLQSFSHSKQATFQPPKTSQESRLDHILPLSIQAPKLRRLRQSPANQQKPDILGEAQPVPHLPAKQSKRSIWISQQFAQ